MRSVVLGCAVVSVFAVVPVLASACARNPPAPSVREVAPAASLASLGASTEDVSITGARLHLATLLDRVEESVDGGAAPLTGKTVLHVGDSMVGGNLGLTRALEQRFLSEGARFLRDYKVSESIVSFDRSPKLKDLLAKHRPDIVIVTLGTNDVFVPYPAVMASNVRSIVGRMATRECYWIGPPTWKPDTGIVKVLRDNVAPCKFYDSSTLRLQRAGDGIHPTDRGGADWAAAFWTFFRAAPAGASVSDLPP